MPGKLIGQAGENVTASGLEKGKPQASTRYVDQEQPRRRLFLLRYDRENGEPGWIDIS